MSDQQQCTNDVDIDQEIDEAGDEIVYNNSNEQIIYCDPEETSETTNTNGADTTGVTQARFSSPDTAAARLSELPQDVMTALNGMRGQDVYNCFLDDLKSNCIRCRDTIDDIEFEWMWYHMVYSICKTFQHNCGFRRQVNPNGYTLYDENEIQTGLADRASVITKHFAESDVLSNIQIMIDITQQRAFSARDHAKKLRETNSDSEIMSQATYAERQLFRRYREFVDLYRQCCGKWKPRPRRAAKSTNKEVKNNNANAPATRKTYPPGILPDVSHSGNKQNGNGRGRGRRGRGRGRS